MIIPVILEKSFDTIATRIKSVDTKAPLIQIDITDGTITNTKTFTDYPMLDTIQTPAKLEIHLMVEKPGLYLQHKVNKCIKICTQIEHGINVRYFIDQAKGHGYKTGICLAVETPWQEAIPYISRIDFIQFMTVKIGEQGQPFEPQVLEKITSFHRKYRRIPVQVDGGVKEINIKQLKKAGVSNFVVGSAIFGGGNPLQNYIQLESLPWIK